MEILGKLFGSEAKAKIARLFLFNPGTFFDVRDISLRTNIKGNHTEATIDTLSKIGLVSKKTVLKEIKRSKGPKSKSTKIKEIAYSLNQKFPYTEILSDLMFSASIKADDRLAKRFFSVGKIKLIIASGVFVRKNDARLDLLIVGDDISESKLDRIIKTIEADVGRDLAYSNLTTADFRYRLDLHDRLIRDVIDFEHIILADRIGFQTLK